MRPYKSLRYTILLGTLFLVPGAVFVAAQDTHANLVGHTITDDSVIFVFDPEAYGLDEAVNTVAVIGNFNDYDATQAEWQLTHNEGESIWTLSVAQGDKIKLGTPFRFVVDGQILQPPGDVDPNYLLSDSEGGSLLIIGGLADLPAQDTIISRLERRVYADTNGHELAYHLLTPEDYDPSISYPLVVFLHGAGERGDSVAPILPYNGAYEFMETASDHAYFMLIPQAPAYSWWDQTPIKQRVVGLVSATQEQFSIDTDRIYIAGLSMGAFGMWAIVSDNPDTFAAGISVCGGLSILRNAPRIAHTPFQVFHGSEDSIVPVTESRATVEALRAANANVEYTEYEGADHWIWVRTFTNPDVIEWLFNQAKS